jgi:RNA polymerase sigma-70 factor (ECF subfamily)
MDMAIQDDFASARTGDRSEFEALVAEHRPGLEAHCYRMLGSLQDAEDACQEALTRAWRGLARFEGRSSVRRWLYRIATNVCLDMAARRPARTLPIDPGAPADRGAAQTPPLTESAWIEPFPHQLEDGYATPESRYELRESVELAFVAALQHLPAGQRAALIMREVLGFSAKETAETLETSVPAVNSLLQRARATVESRIPERSQQATLRGLGDSRVQALVHGYAAAMESADVDAVLSLLTEDAAWSMPPDPGWLRGVDELTQFLRKGPLRHAWRHRATWASCQPAVGSYIWSEQDGAFVAHALDVLSFDRSRICEITAFLPGEAPHHPDSDHARIAAEAFFARFGLPPSISATG